MTEKTSKGPAEPLLTSWPIHDPPAPRALHGADMPPEPEQTQHVRAGKDSRNHLPHPLCFSENQSEVQNEKGKKKKKTQPWFLLTPCGVRAPGAEAVMHAQLGDSSHEPQGNSLDTSSDELVQRLPAPGGEAVLRSLGPAPGGRPPFPNL